MQAAGVERFFFGRDPDTILPRFSKKMLRLLRRYRSRQLCEIERIYNWGKLHKNKPDPNKNHPDDEENIRDAERNLGDYKLKIGHDYEPKITDTLTFKYIEIVECYEQNYNLCDAFNKQLFWMRKCKKILYDSFEEKRKRIEMINKLVPEMNRVEFPTIHPINMEEEYPELNLTENLSTGCGIEISDILDLQKKVGELVTKPPPRPPAKDDMSQHEVHEIQMYLSLKINMISHFPPISELMDLAESFPPLTDPAYYESINDTPSPFLTMRRYHWLLNLIDEQQGILIIVNDQIEKFDEALEKLQLQRFQTKFDENYMLCHLTTLHQELNILRDSEEIENRLLANADEAMRTRNNMQSIINSSNRQIDDARKTIDKLNEQIASLQLKFMSTTKSHKFFDFLRRIFKKKWRPPKPPKGPDESSESSSDDESSSEDEEDTKSIDSSDMTTIRLDATHCPTGLERTMYDLAFKLRSERHALERGLIEQHKVIEQRRAEVNELHRQIKFHENIYAHEKETLLIFRRKRQLELNKVKTCVVVRMDQIQHFYNYKDYQDLSRAVLFDAGRLALLKGRVAQLNDDTLQTRRLYRINIVHLRRMNTDIKFMRYEITRLEEDIKEAMMKKFGMTLNLDDLEEEVLRKYVFELETTAEEELKLIEAEMKKKKLELAQCQEELISETQRNTEKLNVLTVLQEEKNFLDEILNTQDKNYLKWMTPHKLNFDRDIEKLSVIESDQREQIKCLERDICTLRMKSKPLQLYSEVILMEEMTAMEYAAPSGVVQYAEAAEVCPEMLNSEAYHLRSEPDEFIMDRINKVVQKCFVKHFAAHMSADDIRKYTNKATRYLGPAANSVDGKVTDSILECVSETLQTLLPKKYMIHLSSEAFSKLFNEIMIICDYERSEVNTEDVVSGIFTNAISTLHEAEGTLNKTQHIMVKMFQELIEVLPLEEFQSEKTLRVIVDILEKEIMIDPKCINIENLIEKTTKYAKDNLLDGITATPIRRLAENIFRDLMHRKPGLQNVKCGVASVPWITISKKK